MTTSETTIKTKATYISPTRQRVIGIVLLVIAFVLLYLLGSVDASMTTTFNLAPGGSTVEVPDWVFSTQIMLMILMVGCFILGGFQIIKGFGPHANTVMMLGIGMLLFSFIVWAARDNSMNLAGLLRNTLTSAVPITLGAFSGILCERAGVVNIAIEGLMLFGAFIGALVGSFTNLWIGMLVAVLFGGLLAWFHAVLSIKYMTDQIISGTVINIFATGITSFLSAKFLQKYEYMNDPGKFPTIQVPYLSEIPVIGPILFSHNIFIYGLFFFLIVLTIGLFFTKWGLRLRSVGEHPKAADTLGINVFKTRYMAVILGGMLAGFGGAYFTLGSVGRFDEVMTGGRGFIGLAAMIFGNYNPIGAFGAGLLFGFAENLEAKLSILAVGIPSEFLLMAPYIFTMVALAGLVGKTQLPAADGEPYEKEGSH